jgi:hypothetical protein
LERRYLPCCKLESRCHASILSEGRAHTKVKAHLSARVLWHPREMHNVVSKRWMRNPPSLTSQLVSPSGSGAKLEQSSSDGEVIDAVTILLSILERLEAEHCRIRQSRLVGAVLKKLNKSLYLNVWLNKQWRNVLLELGGSKDND